MYVALSSSTSYASADWMPTAATAMTTAAVLMTLFIFGSIVLYLLVGQSTFCARSDVNFSLANAFLSPDFCVASPPPPPRRTPTGSPLDKKIGWRVDVMFSRSHSLGPADQRFGSASMCSLSAIVTIFRAAAVACSNETPPLNGKKRNYFILYNFYLDESYLYLV